MLSSDMGQLQIKNMPDDLHEAVRCRAAAEGMTMSDYLINLIRRDVALPSMRDWLEMVSRHEPVGDVDVVAALDEERKAREAELDAAYRR